MLTIGPPRTLTTRRAVPAPARQLSTRLVEATASRDSVDGVAALVLFAAAREAAGRSRDQIAGSTVGEVLAEAERRYGEPFAKVLAASKVWRNGQPTSPAEAVSETDEVAVLPPVSGG